MLELEFAEISDPGRQRGHNEDFLGHVVPETLAQARSHGWLFAIADGVGGGDLGEVASRLAIETVLDGFNRAAIGEPHSAVLTRLLQTANTRVYEAGRSAKPGGIPMSTTIVACALRFDRVVVAHAGDSRCYLVRGERAVALTRDHTVVQDQARLGLLSAKEAADAPMRHVLSRSLGSDLFVNVDSSEQQVVPGDVLLLCCDGFYHSVDVSDMVAVCGQSPSLRSAAHTLVDLANQRDGSDNISVQLIRVRDVERVGMYRGRLYKLR